MTTIEICMGSSCFSRGNERNLVAIQGFLRDHGLALTAEVKVRGCLCLDACANGPHITVAGTRYPGADPNLCLDILREHVAKEPQA
jgi:NADH:ubiquinone oxidoreductase subunit E